MISKIGPNLEVKNFALQNNSFVKDKKNDNNSEKKFVSNPELLQSYYVNFAGKSQVGVSKSKIDKQGILEDNMTDYANFVMQNAKSIAKQLGNKEIGQLHFLYVSLLGISDYINQLDNGEKSVDEESSYTSPTLLQEEINPKIFADKKKRDLIKPIINEYTQIIENKLRTLPNDLPTGKEPVISRTFLNDLFYLYERNVADDEANTLVDDSLLFEPALYPSTDEYKSEITVPFRRKLSDAIMLNNPNKQNQVHLSVYDEKANNVWKNLSVGTNMVVLRDNEVNPKYMITNILDSLKNSPNGFGNINKENTEVLVLNSDSNIQYLMKKIKEVKKDENKNYVFLLSNTNAIIMNSIPEEARAQLENSPIGLAGDAVEVFTDSSPNIKFIMVMDKDNYYTVLSAQNSAYSKMLADFGEVTVPAITLTQVKKMFKEEPALTKHLKKDFTPSAIQKCVDASAQLSGTFPEKSLRLLDLVSAYYIDKPKEITAADVQNYIKEAKEIFKSAGDDSSIKVVYDTNIKLKDLVGVPSTKKEAQSIVNRIKDKSIGTKGFIIYSQDGSVGAGRKYTAQAIAGESKSPYIEINAMDFGTKEVDLFGGGNISPEASIKKLFSMVKSQAESNSNKSAIIFIENFEYFSVGDLVSEYHQKAMSQLLREMDNAQKQGLNLVVMGSTSDPSLVGNSTSKSFKFIDTIEVESPGYDSRARKDIISYYLPKKGIKLAGETLEDKSKLIDVMTATTQHFSLIEILTLLDKAKNVAKERKHKEIDKADFTEAYLQLTTGRPAMRDVQPHEKQIVTSHECGHAINMTIMHRLSKKRGIPQYEPERVNFITLDPRGMFGGAVFSKETQNDEMSFEKMFADIVCDFGGNSCEKKYGMNGSYGISCDMQMATNTASMMTGIMGQGKNFGKRSLDGAWFISEKDKNVMNKDIDTILINGEITSDLITEYYNDFVMEFTKKYANRVGTGECIIQGDDFEKELDEWLNKQSSETLEKLNAVDNTIVEIMNATKRGDRCRRA